MKKAILSATPALHIDHQIKVTGSKSESNRLLILQALFPSIDIENLSHSDDTVVLSKALSQKKGTVDVHHAGTAMRFLTAFFASQEDVEIVLTGSARMKERPIGILVEAMRMLGAEITYIGEEGFPPLKIKGKKLSANHVTIKANVSSQYISALMLIAPSLPDGLSILLEGKVTSVPYIHMTLSLLHQLGIGGVFSENSIVIPSSANIGKKQVVVESDWSSASYFYSMVALAEEASVVLSSYKEHSLQGDAALSRIYESLGVTTQYQPSNEGIVLTKMPDFEPSFVTVDLINTPDIAQTIAVTCFGLGIGCYLTGLHTLKIKETDRLNALKIELEKLGAQVEITENSLRLEGSAEIKTGVEIATYHDHRMAMAFAPLALRTNLTIMDSEVVSKSFPTFWEDLKLLGLALLLK